MSNLDYKGGFKEFLDDAIFSEKSKRFRPAVSNYYKSLTILCSYLISKKLNTLPKNHSEIFLFLKVNFPNIHVIVNDLFDIYTASYTTKRTKEDCEKIKNAIKKISKLAKLEEDFKEDLKKI